MIGKACIDLVKTFEGLSFKSYPDPATGNEPWTIGYGSTMYPNGDRVRPGEVLSLVECEKLLISDLERRYNAIKNWLPVQINQNQIDSLVSFVYNLGVGNFEKSTLRKKVWSNPNDPTIYDEFLKWNKANKRVMKGLTRRRIAEAELYFTK